MKKYYLENTDDLNGALGLIKTKEENIAKGVHFVGDVIPERYPCILVCVETRTYNTDIYEYKRDDPCHWESKNYDVFQEYSKEIEIGYVYLKDFAEEIGKFD